MMRRNYLRLSLLATAWVMGSVAFAQHTHQYHNGICTVEGCSRNVEGYYEEPQMASDGFYELKNAGHVEWLSKRTSDGNLTTYARLMNDIDYEGIENLHYPIGPDNGKKYNGTFDGQGYRIKNMIINRPNAERQGFFGSLRGNANNTKGEATVVKNLILDKSCSITGGMRTGGIVGSGQNNEKEIYIINCVNEANVTSASNCEGGILGGSEGNEPKWIIRNCVNTGTITCTNSSLEAAAIVSWGGNNSATRIENCLNIGEIVGMGQGKNMWRAGSSVKVDNLIDFSNTEDALQGVYNVEYDYEMEDLTSGKLCFMLNGDQSTITWYQTLGVDAYPVPIAGVSKQVYAKGSFRCDGTPLETVYSNDPSTPTIPDHEFEGDDYHCVNCGCVNPKYCSKDENGFYLISTPKEMNWFAEMVNTKVPGADTMKVKLVADLDYNELEDDIVFIGREKTPYKGYFDGQFHTISNYVVDSSEKAVGVFGWINGGATIKNLRLDNTCSIKGNGVGIVAFCSEDGKVLLECLGNEATMTSIDGGAGGVLGVNTGSKAKLTIRNCYNTGDVTGLGKAENGLLSAWLGSNGAIVENCWASGTLIGAQNEEKWFARHDNATFKNCYAIAGKTVPLFEEEEMENGALCYRMNGDQTNLVWYQNIDMGERDTHPTFLLSHNIVYAVAEKNCDGSFDPEYAKYSNTNSSVIPPHQHVDGFCKNCGHEDASYPFLRVFPNADHNENGGYVSEKSEGGSGLAREYNVVEFWDQNWFTGYQVLTNLEPGTYKLRVQGYSRISAWDEKKANGNFIYDQEEGTPDETLYPLHHNSIYFVEREGKRIANRFMDITAGKQTKKMSEGAENMFTDESYYIPNSRQAAEQYFLKGNYWNAPLYFTVNSTADSIKVGVHNVMYIHGNWTVWDTWRLEKVEGDGIEQIRAQQLAAIQEEIEKMEAQKSLMEAYAKAVSDIQSATTIQGIIDAADVLARNPELIRKSHLAYMDFETAIDAIIAEREGEELNGHYAELLDKYLSTNEAPSTDLPNGTYEYIKFNKPLSDEELKDEVIFVQDLHQKAVKSSVSPGSDITALVVNSGFDEDSKWTGWKVEELKSGSEGSNISCNTGFPDIYPVAGSWNKAFNVYQDMGEGLPNGIYELTAPAFFRPGGDGFDGGVIEDMSSAELFINDYYTQILNIWEDEVSYADAKNGVNCRYDATDDPSAPHNGEQTDSYCFDTNTGYIPGSGRGCISFVFNGGRYVNKAYAIVNNGQLRIGIRNTGEPWYTKEETMWGRFQLKYMGQNDADAQQAMIENFTKRLEKIQYAAENTEYLMYLGHLTTLDNLISAASAKSGAEQLAALVELNEAFNKVYGSHDIYKKLLALSDYCYDRATTLYEKDPELADALSAASEELYDIVYAGELTDEDAEELYNTFMLRDDLGGGYYVQGDLIDANGNNTVYAGDTLNTYKMKKLANGKYFVENVKVQNRTNKPNNNARAGLYISCFGKKFKANDAQRRYVTPENNTHRIFEGAGNDLQMNGGVFDITFDPATGEIVLDAKEYPWHDNVYLVGSVVDGDGEIQTDPDAEKRVRWLNNEDCPLKHQGNGIYADAIEFFEDPKHPGYLAFTLFTCRASDGKPEYVRKNTRSDWYEGRVGTPSEGSIIIDNDVLYEDLVRGADLQWHLVWDNETLKQVYTVVYDMNKNNFKIAKGDHTDAIDEILNGQMEVEGIYTIDGMRVMKLQRGVNIVNGRKVLK